MKVMYIAAECKPFSKVGGVGDVAGELPPALKQLGVDIEIVTPLYEADEYEVAFHWIDEPVQVFRRDPVTFPVPVSFIRNATYFGGPYGKPYVYSANIPYYDDSLRFSFFSEACLELIKIRKPDIVHVNDWPLGYLFGRMEMEGLPQKRVLTVHNIGYQGNIGRETIKAWDMAKILKHPRIGPLFLDPHQDWASVNALRLGLELADRVNTVSPNYCQEMTQAEDQDRYFEGAKGLEEVTRRLKSEGKLYGILNGFDYRFAPSEEGFASTLAKKAEMKRELSANFANQEGLLLGFVGRAVEQKFKLLAETIDGQSVLEHLLDIQGINVAILSSGLPEYETFMKKLTGRKNYTGTIEFNREKAAQISLGSDIFMMPSLFEPCGITQMESLANATPPLVRWTGGLVDTVRPHTAADGTGFGFDGDTREEVLRNFIAVVKEALYFFMNRKEEFRQLQHRGYYERFQWSTAAHEYIDKLYKPLLT
jgi:starch synthase